MDNVTKKKVRLGIPLLAGLILCGLMALFVLALITEKLANRPSITGDQLALPAAFQPAQRHDAAPSDAPKPPTKLFKLPPNLSYNGSHRYAFRETFDTLHMHAALHRYESIPPERQELLEGWIADNRAFLDQIYNQIENLPVDAQPQAGSIFLLGMDLRLMILADGWRALRLRDEPGVERATLALLRLDEFASRDPLAIVGPLSDFVDRLDGVMRLLGAWLEQLPPDAARTERLRPRLDEAAARIFKRENLREQIKAYYANLRRTAVKYANISSWRDSVFGFPYVTDLRGRTNISIMTSDYYHIIDIGGKVRTFPRLTRYLSETGKAMLRKARAPETLRLLDRYWQDILDTCGLPYPEIRTKGWPPRPFDIDSSGFRYSFLDPEAILIPWLTAETRLNLARAALLRRQSPAAAPPADQTFTPASHDPWRDPFTERPLHLDASSSTTVISSMGPHSAPQTLTIRVLQSK